MCAKASSGTRLSLPWAMHSLWKNESRTVLCVALPPYELNVIWRAATFNRLLLQLAFTLAGEFCCMHHGTKTIAEFKSRGLVQQRRLLSATTPDRMCDYSSDV